MSITYRNPVHPFPGPPSLKLPAPRPDLPWPPLVIQCPECKFWVTHPSSRAVQVGSDPAERHLLCKACDPTPPVFAPHTG